MVQRPTGAGAHGVKGWLSVCSRAHEAESQAPSFEGSSASGLPGGVPAETGTWMCGCWGTAAGPWMGAGAATWGGEHAGRGEKHAVVCAGQVPSGNVKADQTQPG